MRKVANAAMEIKRANKDIGSSLEANLTISLRKEMMKFVKGIDLSELCITSSAIIKKLEKKDSEEIKVETKKAKGKKCPVCWKISENDCERHSNN